MTLLRSFGSIRALPDDVDETRTVSFIASDGSKDRHNSIINPKGWDLKSFEKNPIIGYQHNIYGSFFGDDNPDDVIGTGKAYNDDDKLMVDITFEPEDVNPKAEKLFKKVKHGSIRAVSVGFYPTKSHEGDPEENETEEKGVLYYDEAELVEVSLVNIPSNVNAVKNAAPSEKIDLIQHILKQALEDDYSEALTVKGIYSILKGEDKDKVKTENGEKPVTNLKKAESLLIKFGGQ